MPDELRDEALSHFFSEPPSALTVTPTTGGVNNCCQYVDTPDGNYILRASGAWPLLL